MTTKNSFISEILFMIFFTFLYFIVQINFFSFVLPFLLFILLFMFLFNFFQVKVQPSVEEYKRRYIENIEKLVLNQLKLVTFSATLQCKNTENKMNENENKNNDINEVKESHKNDSKDEIIRKNDANYIKESIENFSFPYTFFNGKIKFDSQLAKNLPNDANLRILRNLWSGEKIILRDF